MFFFFLFLLDLDSLPGNTKIEIWGNKHFKAYGDGAEKSFGEMEKCLSHFDFIPVRC